MRLALCDDEANFLIKVEKLIEQYNNVAYEEDRFQVKSYISPQLLADDILEGDLFDVFILDIEMRELDGLLLAEHIRRLYPSSIIIFLSFHTDYNIIKKGYTVDALRYVSKNSIDSDLPEALKAATSRYKILRPSYYIFKYYSQATKISLDDIVYVHRIKRMAEIVTEKNGRLQQKRPLKDLYMELNSDRFIYIDKGCFVNINYVTQINESSIQLSNHDILPVSRKKLPLVKTAILHFWGGINS